MHPNTELGLIHITGPDAEKFLQGQLTCDVREAKSSHPLLGAHCDHKGRIQATFRLFKDAEHYYLLLPQSVIPHLLQCLQKYAVFSKVTLTEISDAWQQIGIFGEKDPAWLLKDIRAGIPTIFPETIGLFTPQQINFPAIQGVSFTKGCYTGQEIVARMHYLGKIKQRMYRVCFSQSELPAPGTALFIQNGQQEVGNIVQAAFEATNKIQALAVIFDHAISDGVQLAEPTGVKLEILDLPYATS